VPKLIVWLSWETANDCVTGEAALILALPAWFAAMIQVPTPTKVTVEPDTVHTEPVVELYVTGNPTLLAADTANGAAPKVCAASVPKLIVWLSWDTANDCATSDAAATLALPAWSAAMVQVPAPTKVTVEPDTVQTEVVLELNATGRPALLVADTVYGAAPKTCAASAAKLIVWVCAVTLNDCVTGAAALTLALPAWLAAIVQVPRLTKVTVEPDTVHTEVVLELKVTGKPALLVADTENGAAPSGCPGSAAKLMVWVSIETVNDCVTWVAALTLALPA
jgi:hypothetical protein